MDIIFFAVIVLILAGVGKKFFSCLLPGVCISFLEEAVVSFALGAGSVALLVLGIGLVGLLYRWVAIILLAGLGMIARKDIVKLLRGAVTWCAGSFRKDFSTFERFILAALFFVFLFTLIGALSPILGMDSASYHMRDAKVFLLQHRVTHIPYTRESLWPFLVQMLFVLGLCLKGVALAKLFHFAFYTASVLAIYVLCRRYWPRSNSILAAAVFALLPAIFTGTTYAYTDLAVVFYTVMAFYGFFTWVDTDSPRWFCLSGIMSGFLMGIKITSAIVPAVILVLYVHRVLFSPARLKEKILPLLIFILAMLTVCGIWYIRSWIILGNPIFPFVAELFGGAGYPKETLRYETTSGIGTGPIQFILMFWPLTLDPARFGGESVGPLFLIFLPVLVFAKKLGKFIRYIAVIALCLYASWFFVYQFTRFLYPTLVFCSMLVGFAYYDILWADPVLRKIASCVLVGSFCYSSALSIYHNVDKFPVVFGLQTDREYLLKHERSFGIADYVNTHIPKDAKILVLSEQRLYYFNRRVAMVDMIQIDYVQNKHRDASQSFEEFLRERGFGDYLLSMRDLSKNYKPSEPLPWLKNLYANYGKTLLKQMEFAYRDERYVYEVWKITNRPSLPS